MNNFVRAILFWYYDTRAEYIGHRLAARKAELEADIAYGESLQNRIEAKRLKYATGNSMCRSANG